MTLETLLYAFTGGYIQEQEVGFLGLEYACIQLYTINRFYISTSSIWATDTFYSVDTCCC